LLRQLRWRKSPRDRRQLWLAALVAVILHAVFIVVMWREMRPPVIADVVHVRLDQVMQMRFIEASVPTAAAPPPPAAPLPLPPPAPKPAPPRRPEPNAKDALTIQSPPQPVESAPARLFDRNGQPLLPSAARAPAPATPGYASHLPQGDTRIMQHDDPIKYQATRFDGDWAKGNTVDQALQKLVDKTTVKKTVRLPGGVRVHCAVFLLFGGCSGEPPAPPSAKDGDERLSMAPAKSLAADPHPPKPPGIDACIAMYRVGKPLAWGCPVDTPNRAIDQQTRERAAGSHGHP
jgi:hypothetical protein